MKVAVVILNWNGRKFLEKFLPAVIEHSKIAEIIIADNASADDSIDFMNNTYPEIRLIILDKNYGFAEGYNRALEQVKSEYYVLLNSDIEVTPDWIEPVISMMDADANIAACQPKLRSYHEPEMFEYAGAAGGYIDKYGYPFCRGRLFQSLEKDHGQYDDAVEIFWATGACMFVRADIYHEIRGLDNDFFAHMEEIDFCWRAKNYDYKIQYCPDSVVYHIGGGTLPKNNARKTFLNIRNNNIMLFKNLPSNRLVKVFIARIFLDFVASLKFLADGGLKDFFAVYKAHFAFWSRLGYWRVKRRRMSHKNVSMIFWKNIVFQHYLRKKMFFSQLDQSKFTKDPS